MPSHSAANMTTNVAPTLIGVTRSAAATTA
jgi:hypothetical protein